MDREFVEIALTKIELYMIIDSLNMFGHMQEVDLYKNLADELEEKYKKETL